MIIYLLINCIIIVSFVHCHTSTTPEIDTKQGRAVLAAGVAQLDIDFVFAISTLQPHQPRMCIERSLAGTYAAMVTLAPKIELANQKGEFVFFD